MSTKCGELMEINARDLLPSGAKDAASDVNLDVKATLFTSLTSTNRRRASIHS